MIIISIAQRHNKNVINPSLNKTTSETTNIDEVSLKNFVEPVGYVNPNVVKGISIVANNSKDGNDVTKINDGDTSSYWEGATKSYPNTLNIDLGKSENVGSINIKLPTTFKARTQTLDILSSNDNVTFNNIVKSTAYKFDPTSNNTATIAFSPTSARYIKINFTSNSDSVAAAQVGELEIYSRGATLPYVELEAENGKTNGTIIGPATSLYNEASEASARKAVKLDTTGQYVKFTATSNANSIVVRYSIPDSKDGTGINSTLSLYVNNGNKQELNLTSKYAWEYGNYPWTNNPADGKAHRFYDEVHVFIGDVKAGDTITLQKDDSDTSPYFLIDLVDLENVSAPKEKPANFLSIEDFGAIANDNKDDTYQVLDCIAAAKAKGQGVWIPKGAFNIDSINVAEVTIRGAGVWYSIFTGPTSGFNCMGDNCKFYDFSIFGETIIRNDNAATDNAFSGYPGKNSVLDNIWVEHKKCGFWVGNSIEITPVDNLNITNCRFRNLMADGINFCNGTSNSLVENCNIRYSGDDSIATWSVNTNTACNNNTFRYNTIQIPWLASGISIYGGSNHTVEYNAIYDTVTGGSGIYISSNFNPVPFSGTITARENTLIRCGSNECYTGYPPGAIRLLAYNSDINKGQIILRDNDIFNSVLSGISIQGSKSMTKVLIKNTRINGCNSYGIHVDDNSKGDVIFQNVTVKNASKGGLENDSKNHLIIKKSTGNIGW